MTGDAGAVCGFAVERAREGPCEVCDHDGGHAPMKVGGVVVQHDTYCYLCNNEHEWRGPVEATCGHPESEHGVGEESGRAGCHACAAALTLATLNYDAVFHAFTEAP